MGLPNSIVDITNITFLDIELVIFSVFFYDEKYSKILKIFTYFFKICQGKGFWGWFGEGT